MKTPEDEAFDDIARKQGMWGGGFTAKRQAAMDKINAEFSEEYIKYRTSPANFPKEYAAPQPSCEPIPKAKVLDTMAKYRVEEDDDDIQVYQKPWVGLTEEERASFEAANPKTQEEWDKLFDGIEAKLKARNHG